MDCFCTERRARGGGEEEEEERKTTHTHTHTHRERERRVCFFVIFFNSCFWKRGWGGGRSKMRKC